MAGAHIAKEMKQTYTADASYSFLRCKICNGCEFMKKAKYIYNIRRAYI